MTDTKPLVPYLVSAIADKTGSVKWVDISFHVGAWVLLLIFEGIAFGNMQTHIQYMEDTATEMSERLSKGQIEQITGSIVSGQLAGSSSTPSTPSTPSTSKPSPLAQLLNGPELDTTETFLKSFISGSRQKTDLHTWALTQLATASLTTVIVGAIFVLFVIILHVSSAGVVSGGLPGFITSVIAPTMYSSIVFTVLARIVVAVDWVIDYFLRQTIHQSMMTSAVANLLGLAMTDQQLSWKIAAERNADRGIWWMLAIILKLYVVAFVRSNVRIADKADKPAYESASA